MTKTVSKWRCTDLGAIRMSTIGWGGQPLFFPGWRGPVGTASPASLSLVFLLCCSAPAFAAYVPDDPDTVYALIGYRHDDNVLLLNPSISVPPGNGSSSRGDTITTYTIGGQYKKDWSRQTFTFNSEFSRNQYQNYTGADYTNWDNGLAWNWVAADQLTGKLSATDSNTLAGASTAVLSSHDVIRDKEQKGSAHWAMNSVWEWVGELEHLSERHQALDIYDFDQTYEALDLIAHGNGGKSLGVRAETRQVRYVQDLSFFGWNNDYKMQILSLHGEWPLGARLVLSGRAGSTRITTDSNLVDETHAVGEATARWNTGGKSQFTLDYEHDYDSPGRSFAPSAIQHDIARIDFAWMLTAKTTLNGEWRTEKRHYPTINVFNLQGVGPENTRTYQLSVQWQPRQNVSISPYYEHTVRSSQSIYDTYRDNQLGVTLQVNF